MVWNSVKECNIRGGEGYRRMTGCEAMENITNKLLLELDETIGSFVVAPKIIEVSKRQEEL